MSLEENKNIDNMRLKISHLKRLRTARWRTKSDRQAT